MWATNTSTHLPCFTAPIYSDLHSPPGTCYPIPPRSWSQFLWCFDSSCKITRDASYLQLPLRAKVIEVRGKPAHTHCRQNYLGPRRRPLRLGGYPSQREQSCDTLAGSCPSPSSLFCFACPRPTPWPIYSRHRGMAVYALPNLLVCPAMGHPRTSDCVAFPDQGRPTRYCLLRNSSPVGPAAHGL